MELFNELSDFDAQPATASAADVFAVREALESLIVMLAPFSPHVAEEMWERLGHTGGLIRRCARTRYGQRRMLNWPERQSWRFPSR